MIRSRPLLLLLLVGPLLALLVGLCEARSMSNRADLEFFSEYRMNAFAEQYNTFATGLRDGKLDLKQWARVRKAFAKIDDDADGCQESRK